MIVITSYPEKGLTHGIKTVGIASYAKNTLLGILKASKKPLPITVLAEKFNKKEEYYEKNILVKRIWKRGKISSYPSLLKEIFISKTDKVLFEFEISMFGNELSLIPLPIFLLILKILNKKTFFVSHQIITDLNNVSGHIGLRNNSLKTKILNVLLNLFYKFTFLNVYKVIVFEEKLKKQASKFTKQEKIIVIPHGVEDFKINKRTLINNSLNLLYFGYIAWYKGTDWLVNFVNQSKIRNLKLTIAGGKNPNHNGKKYYQDYVRSVENSAKKITVTGYVKQKNIGKYFQDSDLVILPYRSFMSSSGPLSLAISFQKPFLISSALKPITKTADFKRALIKANLKPDDITFDLTNESLEKKLKNLSRNKLVMLSKILKTERSFEKIGSQYLKAIYD